MKYQIQSENANQAGQSRPELFHKAVRLHQKGISGEKKSVSEAFQLFEQIRKQVPEDNLVTAYYGSTLCLLGRDAVEPMERFANTIRGLKYLDQAVDNEPDNFEIRIIRGNICVNLPEMYFHRNITAVADFKYLLSCYEKSPDVIPDDLYLQFLYNLSISYHNLGQTKNAEEFRRRLLDEVKNPKYREIINQKENGKLFFSEDSFYFLLQPLPAVLEEGERLHLKALSGETVNIQKALQFFNKAQTLYPDDQIFKAYIADCMSLAARNATNTGEMFSGAIKAIKALDSAVAEEPDNIKIRLIRANQSMRLPESFFARTATAISDLEYLSGRCRKEPNLIKKEQFEEIRFNLGLCYHRLGLGAEGNEVWRDLLPDASQTIQIKIEKYLQNNLPLKQNENLSLETNRDEFFSEGKRLHSLGVAGNKTAARIALKLWEKAHAADPGDPVAQGYYGSSLALVGKYSLDINEMFGNGIKGLNQLNEALERVPDNWELRLHRAYLAYSLPEVFFHTTRQAIEDFQYLIKAYEQNTHLFSKECYEQLITDLQNACQTLRYNCF